LYTKETVEKPVAIDLPSIRTAAFRKGFWPWGRLLYINSLKILPLDNQQNEVMDIFTQMLEEIGVNLRTVGKTEAEVLKEHQELHDLRAIAEEEEGAEGRKGIVFPIIFGVVSIIIGVFISKFVSTASGEWPNALSWGCYIFGGSSILLALWSKRPIE
jgi:hypothetical protein